MEMRYVSTILNETGPDLLYSCSCLVENKFVTILDKFFQGTRLQSLPSVSVDRALTRKAKAFGDVEPVRKPVLSMLEFLKVYFPHEQFQIQFRFATARQIFN
jgi:hypothetical protein